MASLTRQDVQSVVEQARTRLIDHVASRQDMQTLQGTVKTLTTTLQQSQQLLRQEENQNLQLARRIGALESRMMQLEHELQQLRRVIVHLDGNQPNERVRERVIVTRPGEQPFTYTQA